MSTPQDVRDPARAVAFDSAALRLELQHMVTSIQIARHHLKHERVGAAERVLRAAVEAR
jgi:hypothetical protein